MLLNPLLHNLINFKTVSDAELAKTLQITLGAISESNNVTTVKSLELQLVQVSDWVIENLDDERRIALANLLDKDSAVHVILSEFKSIQDFRIELQQIMKDYAKVSWFLASNFTSMSRDRYSSIIENLYNLALKYKHSRSTSITTITVLTAVTQHWNSIVDVEHCKQVFNEVFDHDKFKQDPVFIENSYKYILHSLSHPVYTSNYNQDNIIAMFTANQEKSYAQMYYTRDIIKIGRRLAVSLLLEDRFDMIRDLSSTEELGVVAGIIRTLDNGLFNSGFNMLKSVRVTKSSHKSTVSETNTFLALSRRLNWSTSHHLQDMAIVSLMTKDELAGNKDLLMRVSGINHNHRRHDFKIHTGGYLVTAPLEETVKFFRSRFWVEFILLSKLMAGVLTDQEILWALTHQTNSNIQNGAMLFMQLMMKFNVEIQESLTLADTQVAALRISTANSGTPLAKILEDNFPESYCMYAVFTNSGD